MMKLDKNNIKRTEKYCGHNVVIFDCLKCKENEIKVRPTQIDKNSGLCFICAIRKRPFEQKYNSFVDSVKRTNKARNRDVPIELTYEEFLEFTEIKNCTYCNKELIWIPHGTNKQPHRGSNLDRKDNNKGYSKENCTVCCGDCNIMKNKHFSHDEFLEIAKLLDKMRNGTFIKKNKNEN